MGDNSHDWMAELAEAMDAARSQADSPAPGILLTERADWNAEPEPEAQTPPADPEAQTPPADPDTQTPPVEPEAHEAPEPDINPAPEAAAPEVRKPEAAATAAGADVAGLVPETPRPASSGWAWTPRPPQATETAPAPSVSTTHPAPMPADPAPADSVPGDALPAASEPAAAEVTPEPEAQDTPAPVERAPQAEPAPEAQDDPGRDAKVDTATTDVPPPEAEAPAPAASGWRWAPRPVQAAVPVDAQASPAPTSTEPPSGSFPAVNLAEATSQEAASGETGSELPPADPASDHAATDHAAPAEGAAEAPADGSAEAPAEAAADAPAGGTILIPAGQAVLPDAMRRAPDPDADEGVVAAPAQPGDAEPAGHQDAQGAALWLPRPASSPDLAAAIAAVDARPLSLPPVRANTAPPVVRPSQPSMGTPGPFSAEERRETTEGRHLQRRTVILIGLLVLAVTLTAVMILVAVRQSNQSARQRTQQIRDAHSIGLDTIADANEPVAAELAQLSEQSRPDLAPLAEVAVRSAAIFEGLVVPAADGEFVSLARNLQNAIDTELAFLERLEAFAGIELADIQQSDVDQLLRAWATAEDAIRLSYADQPELDIADLTATGSAVAEFGTHVATAAEDARERAAKLADVTTYAGQMLPLFDQLERLRADLSRAGIKNIEIRTSTDMSTTLNLLNSGAEARWNLAETTRQIQPPAEFASTHTELAAAFEALGDAVSSLTPAVYEADCSGYAYYYAYVSCSTLSQTTTYSQFVRASDIATKQYERAKSAFVAKHTALLEAYR